MFYASQDDEETERQDSGKSDGLHRSLRMEREANAALEDDLRRLRRGRAEKDKALRQERREKEALARALEKERAKRDTLRIEFEVTKAGMASLKRSAEAHQLAHAKLQKQTSKMTAELKENGGVIEELRIELRAKCDVIAQGTQSTDELTGELGKLREGHLEKDEEIQSLQFSVGILQRSVAVKDDTISLLQEKDDRFASDLKEEQAKSCRLQRDYEAVVSEQQKNRDELVHLTLENQTLASEDQRLRGELEDSLRASRLAREQQQQRRRDGEARSRLKDGAEKERAQVSRARRKKEKKAPADPEGAMYDMQTLRMENEDIRAKFRAMEAKYDAMFKDGMTHSPGHGGALICKDPEAVAKLQYMVFQFKAQQSEGKTRRALNLERTQRAVSEERASHTAAALERERERANHTHCALERERATCQEVQAELREALIRQIETLEERQHLTTALRSAERGRRSRERGLRAEEREPSADEANESVRRLREEYEYLGRKHLHVQSNYRELLESHNALQGKYQRLSSDRNSVRLSSAELRP